jgi:hypothetical protein
MVGSWLWVEAWWFMKNALKRTMWECPAECRLLKNREWET